MKQLTIALIFTLCLLISAIVLADNNCCHLPGSDCQTEQDWIRGYYDIRNNSCPVEAAAGQSEPATPSTPAPAQATEPPSDESQAVNNCCFISWHCESDAQWVSGYYAHQAGDSCTTESQSNYQPTTAHQAELQAASASPDDDDEDEDDDEFLVLLDTYCPVNPKACYELIDEHSDEFWDYISRILFPPTATPES